MKKLVLPVVLLLSMMMHSALSQAQAVPTSAQTIEEILSVVEHRGELARLNSGITALLADARLTDQAARQMLQESQAVFTEMLNQKVGLNAGKLVDLAKWLRAQDEEKQAVHEAGGTPTPQQQFALDNPLAEGRFI